MRADRGQIGQVLVNLIANARDALTGVGKVTVETLDVELPAEGAAAHPGVAPGPYSVIVVRDSGAGMTEHVRQQIFDPFFSTKGTSPHTGLGLATVYGIVTQSGGQVLVDSEPGNGAVFRVYLPVVADALTRGPAPDITPLGLPRAALTVLIADDENLVRAVIVRTMKRAGFTVLEASDGDKALASAKAHPGTIDLLISDVVMPGLSGAALADAIEAVHPKLRTLFVSGYTEGVALLTKPFSPDDLLRRVRSLLADRTA